LRIGCAVRNPCLAGWLTVNIKDTSLTYIPVFGNMGAMALDLITVVETQSYLTAAKGLLSEAERTAVIDMVAADPECGVALGGGIRKVRIGVDGRGKRGGGRVVYIYAGQDIPVFLMTVFAKNEMANLSRSEQAGLAEIAASIIKGYRRNQ
jgi:hypothetical protein